MSVNAFGIAKADWKNIEQRKVEARNGRRGKRQGATAIGVGAAGVAAGVANGGDRVVADVGIHAKSAFLKARKGKLNIKDNKLKLTDPENFNSAAKQGLKAGAKRFALHPTRSKLAGGAVAGGAALIAGGAAKYGSGLAREKHAENKIKIKIKIKLQLLSRTDGARLTASEQSHERERVVATAHGGLYSIRVLI